MFQPTFLWLFKRLEKCFYMFVIYLLFFAAHCLLFDYFSSESFVFFLLILKSLCYSKKINPFLIFRNWNFFFLSCGLSLDFVYGILCLASLCKFVDLILYDYWPSPVQNYEKSFWKKSRNKASGTCRIRLGLNLRRKK